jgi:hypothetical protein
MLMFHFIIDFDWLRSRNHLPLFVRPEQSTAVIVPHRVEVFGEKGGAWRAL